MGHMMDLSDLYGQPIRRFPWLWSILKPQWRFVTYENDGFGFRIGSDWFMFWLALRLEYERQILAELIDPEWPSSYWESVADSMSI